MTITHTLIWLVYFFGQALHILKRADLSVKSPLSQGARIRDFVVRNWLAIAIRLSACTGVFMAWLSGAVHAALPALHLGWAQGLLPTPESATLLAVATAGAFGFCTDSLIDWFLASRFPALQKELPPIPSGDSSERG